MSEKYTKARITFYQWVYIHADEDTGVITLLPYAQWDETMGAWLVGFGIYPWDPTAPSIPYDISFPSPFIEPVPANDYNPLDI